MKKIIFSPLIEDTFYTTTALTIIDPEHFNELMCAYICIVWCNIIQKGKRFIINA